MSNEKRLQSKLDSVLNNTQSIVEEIKKHSEPIDLSQFEKEGIIEKKGAWYKVNNMNEIPENLRNRIDQLKQSNDSILVKFTNPAKFEKLAKKFEKMGFKGSKRGDR